ncbi:type II toxin-antitoxin system RatA family toxin [Pseudoroseicyclus aestuarii]|uniref:Coenzyme Q-binding protein COQ10 n=1 Tax=Pseudoroseicyclus aestuarii TaxID=1795041 RepID=A0A318SNN2_9RHOB|nr:type II toxin-antitoxin system RatA family toxin [Pseudoroseicyclus aestuarii]PYE81185.1 coenzyme Q-binding protein COQ10 [Pseudoroseicyclus aestuarii]
MPTHSETRVLPYTPQQMYDLVADVASYPQFLPWCAAARIRSTEDMGDHSEMLADLVVSFKVFRESFGSRVTLWPEAKRIDTEYVDGPFRKMDSRWEFAEAPGAPGSCEIRFRTSFEFKNRLLSGAAGMFFNEAMQRIVGAFERRAKELYG